jgi:hypothetical protein
VYVQHFAACAELSCLLLVEMKGREQALAIAAALVDIALDIHVLR